MRTQAGKFTLCGDGLCVGRDSGDAVSKEYKAGFAFKGGTIQGVAVTVATTLPRPGEAGGGGIRPRLTWHDDVRCGRAVRGPGRHNQRANSPAINSRHERDDQQHQAKRA